MSTIYAVYIGKKDVVLEDDMISNLNEDDLDNDFVDVAFQYNDGEFIFKNPLAKFLPDSLPVYSMDNTQQGIYTIGDIKKVIMENNK